MAPWADALFAIDGKWWRQYLPEVRRDFRGVLYSSNDFSSEGITRMRGRAFGNSGAGAVALANSAGASRVILLGYDCGFTGGQVHWHGDHPPGLGNAGSLHSWPEKFRKLADTLACDVINCSRETALRVFPRGRLEDVLCL